MALIRTEVSIARHCLPRTRTHRMHHAHISFTECPTRDYCRQTPSRYLQTAVCSGLPLPVILWDSQLDTPLSAVTVPCLLTFSTNMFPLRERSWEVLPSTRRRPGPVRSSYFRRLPAIAWVWRSLTIQTAHS